VKEVNNKLPQSIISLVQERAPWSSLDNSLNDSLKNNLSFIISLYVEGKQIREKEKDFQEKINYYQSLLKGKEYEHKTLVEVKPQYLIEISEIRSMLPQLGVEALNLKLAHDN